MTLCFVLMYHRTMSKCSSCVLVTCDSTQCGLTVNEWFVLQNATVRSAGPQNFLFFLLSLFVTLYIFLHLTVMHSSTFGKGWVGMSACPLVVLACESLHVCTVCIWRCEHARFCVEVFYALYINFHSFIHYYFT